MDSNVLLYEETESGYDLFESYGFKGLERVGRRVGCWESFKGVSIPTKWYHRRNLNGQKIVAGVVEFWPVTFTKGGQDSDHKDDQGWPMQIPFRVLC